MSLILVEFHKVACSQCIINMQSTSLCTVQHGRKHFSQACMLAFVWRYQGYCFFPWRNLARRGEDIFVNCFLFWSGCTGRVTNLFMSNVYGILENGWSWRDTKECSEAVYWCVLHFVYHSVQILLKPLAGWSSWSSSLTHNEGQLLFVPALLTVLIPISWV